MYFSTVNITSEIWGDKKSMDLLRTEDEYHSFIWSLFPSEPSTARDFLYRIDTRTQPPRFYVVSSRKPQAGQGLSIRTIEYTPQLQVGDRLSFDARLNPIVQRSRGKGKRSAKHDVVMDAKFHDDARHTSEQLQYERVTDAVRLWFARKSEHGGFELENDFFRVDQYQQHRIRRSRSKRHLTISSAECKGVLRVTDPERFLSIAYKGIGSARAFGCGLMMLKRAPDLI